MTDTALVIRRASVHDDYGLYELATLDSAAPPTGEVVLAERGGELWAAVEVDSGRAIADPFRPSGELVELLRLHVSTLREEPSADRGLLTRLLPRVA